MLRRLRNNLIREMKLTLHVILHYTPKDIESSTESRISRPKTALQDEELGFLIASFFLEKILH